MRKPAHRNPDVIGDNGIIEKLGCFINEFISHKMNHFRSRIQCHLFDVMTFDVFFSFFITSQHTIGLTIHLKHLGRSRLGVLIIPMWLWLPSSILVDSNPQSFDREPSSLPTRPQLSLKTGMLPSTLYSECEFRLKNSK